MTKVNRALKASNNCYSFRGNDFDLHDKHISRTADRTRFAKRVTRRANRRLSKALVWE